MIYLSVMYYMLELFVVMVHKSKCFLVQTSWTTFTCKWWICRIWS